MDFIKKATDSVSGSGSGSKSETKPKASGQQDYVDKAFDFGSKKAGHDFAPGTDEKITDGARSVYEKVTGSKVNDKYSN